MSFKRTWLDNYHQYIGFTKENGQTSFEQLPNFVLPSVYAKNEIKTVVGTAGNQTGGTKIYDINGDNLEKGFKELEKKMVKDFNGLGDYYYLELKKGGKKFYKLYKKNNI
jgi:hypothetical protein